MKQPNDDMGSQPQKAKRYEVERKVFEEDDRPVIISQKYITLGVKCPECNMFHKCQIKVIKSTCPNCKKEFEKDVSKEEKGEYDQETLKTAAWILLKKLGQKPPRGNEAVISVNDSHMIKAQFLMELFSHLGVEKKDMRMGKAKMSDGKEIDVWMITLEKNEHLRYQEETKNRE